jgi:uracil-DNA glycosylase
MSKILIIGQAPTDQKQSVPYDTTLLYEMINWVGIDKEKAQTMFDFESVSNIFPGKNKKGHFKPTTEQMDKHWEDTLETKMQLADKVWILGKVAANYIESKPKTWSCNLEIIETPHPSKRNYSLIMNNKNEIINKLQSLFYTPPTNTQVK